MSRPPRREPRTTRVGCWSNYRRPARPSTPAIGPRGMATLTDINRRIEGLVNR